MNTLRGPGKNGNNVGRLGSRLAIVEHGVSAMRIVHAVRELGRTQSMPIRLVAVCPEFNRNTLFARSCDEITTYQTVSDLNSDNFARSLTALNVSSIWLGAPVESDQDLRTHLIRVCQELEIAVINHATGDDTIARGAGPLNQLADPHARQIDISILRDGDSRPSIIGITNTTARMGRETILTEAGVATVETADLAQIYELALRSIDNDRSTLGITVSVEFVPGEDGSEITTSYRSLDISQSVIEEVSGINLAELVLRPPTIEQCPPEEYGVRGHAVAAEIRAVDPERDFTPTPGKVERLRIPTGTGIRVDLAYGEGDIIASEADPTIATITAWGNDREEAYARLHRALTDLMVVVSGGVTNQGFLIELLDHRATRHTATPTTWVNEFEPAQCLIATRDANVALVAAAIEVAGEIEILEESRFYNWARRGRPRVSQQLGHTVELRHRNCIYSVELAQLGPTRWRVAVDGTTIELDLERLSQHERRFRCGNETHRIVAWSQGPDLLISVNGISHRVTRDDVGLVRSPAPAVVVAITTRENDVIRAGDAVAVVETMKIETVLRAPFDSRVKQILVGTNVQVDSGSALVRLEPIRSTDTATAADRLDFRNLAIDDTTINGDTISNSSDKAQVTSTRQSHVSDWQLAEWLILGYSVPEDDVLAIAMALHLADLPDDAQSRRNLCNNENKILRLFASIQALRRPRDLNADEDHARGSTEFLHEFLRSFDVDIEGLPPRYTATLRRVAGAFGIQSLDRTSDLETAMFRAYRSLERHEPTRSLILAILGHRLTHAGDLIEWTEPDFRELLNELIETTQVRDPMIADLARQVRYRYFDQPLLDAARETVYRAIEPHIDALADQLPESDRRNHITTLVNCSQHLSQILTQRLRHAGSLQRNALIEVMARRYYRSQELSQFQTTQLAIDAIDEMSVANSPLTTDDISKAADTVETASEMVTSANHGQVGQMRTFEIAQSNFFNNRGNCRLAVAFLNLNDVKLALRALGEWEQSRYHNSEVADPLLIDLYTVCNTPLLAEDLYNDLAECLRSHNLGPSVERVVVVVAASDPGEISHRVEHFTFERDPNTGELQENTTLRGIHPMMADRLNFWRFDNFNLSRLPSAEDVYLFHAIARENHRDERLFALAEVRDLMPVHDSTGRVIALPELELVLRRAVEGIRRFQALRPPAKRLQWNRIFLNVWPPVELEPDEIRNLATRVARGMGGLGIEMTMVQGRLRNPFDLTLNEQVLRISSPTGSGVVIELSDPPSKPLAPLDEYTQKVVRARSRGTTYPYELIQVIAPPEATAGLPAGDFSEYDLNDDGSFGPIDRPRGRNTAGVVVGITRSFTDRYPEGMKRVAIFGDPTKALGAISQPECRRIMAALDLAETLGVPVEWFALSAGAKIAMDSGTENMDGVAIVLRRIIEFTQAGGEINIIVAGINVGAQPYWNAEATMLMHTKGILVMTPQSAMVLTGKQALEYSGGVSAEDNFGIGGYERIMGPNGQAQYWARDITSACRILMAHYEHAYRAPQERFPRRARTSDPSDRDITTFPHDLAGSEFTTIGDVFSPTTNPDRKKSFDMRTMMRACSDQDHPVLERWADMRGASTGIVWDAHIDGWPVTMIGIESHIVDRHGPVPADGPLQWSAGTLFPQSSKKIARAINATSGNRPLVVLANLSGFDGSPESMRLIQLEYGAEIGRAIVNFDGPIIFCVVSRFHGGAFVVFSRWLNDNLEAVAVEGSRASVIGGAPAAAVVFSHEVDMRTRDDPRIADLDERIRDTEGTEHDRLMAERESLFAAVRAEKLGELADEFDSVHSVERALNVGSIDRIIAPGDIRAFLADAVERGITRTLNRSDEQS